MKKCSKCKGVKKITEFYKNKSEPDGYQHECKSCRSKTQKKYRTDPKRERKYNLKKKYGITPSGFDMLLQSQNGVCAICGTNVPRGKGNFHVDHDHKTGEIRGLLCNNCNSLLGFANDNIFTLISAIKYLRHTKSETQGFSCS